MTEDEETEVLGHGPAPDINEKWIARRKSIQKNIKRFKLGDRIENITQVAYIHNAIQESIMGWSPWLNNWIIIELNKKIKVIDKDAIMLTDSELITLFNKMRGFALQFIEFDIEYTELISKKAKQQPKKIQKEEPIFDLKKMGVV